MTSRFPAAAALGAFFLASLPAATVPAQAAGAVLGSLTCIGEGGTGYIIGSSKNMTCRFNPANGALPTEAYAGTLSTVGVDVGYTGETVLKWIVLAASLDAYDPGALSGKYVGAGADASVVAGVGVKVLVGGPSRGFTLQPVSVQAQTGLNVAAGVTSLRLASVVPDLREGRADKGGRIIVLDPDAPPVAVRRNDDVVVKP